MQAHFSPKEFIPLTTPIHKICASKSFSQLELKHKKYAYHMAQASWLGSKICWFQRSYEAPALLVLLKSMFAGGLPAFKEASIKAGLSEEEWQQLTAYSAGVFQNCGNYLSFGDTKFVPELT